MTRPLLLCLALVVGCQEYDLNSQPDGVDLEGVDEVAVPGGTPGEDADPGGQDADPEVPEDPGQPGEAEDTLPEEPVETADPTDYSESFQLPVDSPVDVIVFGDTSGSMSAELQDLGDNIETFTNRLVSEGVDWRLMAVNGDDGCGIDGWFDSTTPDWQTRFADALLVQPDDLDEAGLEATTNAVENPCNAGFLRPNALLHVIFISDEEDQSQGHNQPLYWQSYVDRMHAVKGGPGLLTLSAVAGPTPNGCNGADAGFGYDEAVVATQGEFLSICDDWAPQLDTLATAAVIQDTFPLANVADPLTIQVSVDGVARPNADWIFDQAGNAVVFVANPPQPGADVEIDYSSP